MKKIIFMLSMLIVSTTALADTFSYRFKQEKLSEALTRIAEDHPGLYLNFIYNELGNYKTSAAVNTDDTYEALKQTVGLNPVSVVKRGNRYFVEALQHGKYRYTGRAIATDQSPVEAATVWLLSPKDSTVLTYGITDASGRFSIPCDKTEVIAKLSSLGYRPVFKNCDNFNVGTIVMDAYYVNLKALDVEPDYATVYSDRTVYRPSSRQKRTAHNATDLLRALAIPQIQVSPVNSAVTDNVGKPVRLFINSVEATSQDLQGLATMDVRNVEYLEFPTDPRFKGAERAVNFIIQEYEYGGYTKLYLNEGALTGLSNYESIFSKFTYKRMTYDLFTSVGNSNNRHKGNSSETRFRLTDEAGNDFFMTKNSQFEKSQYRENSFPVTFRASYATDKVQIRNTVGYTHTTDPVAQYQGVVSYAGAPVNQPENRAADSGLITSSDDERHFLYSNPSITNSASYSGSFYFSLPRDFSIDATPTFNYSHINDTYSYDLSGSEPIYRHVRENAYNYRLDLNARKQFNPRNILTFGANVGAHANNLKYMGDVNYADRFNNNFLFGLIGYNFKNSRFSLNTDMGWGWEHSDINHMTVNDFYPFIHLNMQYAFSQKHSLSTYFQYATNSPGITEKSSDVLRNDELLYITGNPYLKDSRHVTFQLAYSLFPSDIFYMNVYGLYYQDFNRLMTVYDPYDGGCAVLRNYINNGDFRSGRIGANMTLRLFKRSLQLSLIPQQLFYRSTGVYNKKLSRFHLSAQAYFYTGNFYFNAYYSMAAKSMDEFDPVISRMRDYYYIQAGWANSHLNISLRANNFIRHDWMQSTTVTDSPFYSQNATSYNISRHAALNFSITYTFNYGRKVQRSNEIGAQSGASSAILKE